MSRSQIIALVLIVALIGNTFLHFFHPAYREYRRMSAELNSQTETFRRDVMDSFIPVVSNIVKLIEMGSPSAAQEDVTYTVKTSMPLIVGSQRQEMAQLSYAHCGDSDYVVVNGKLALAVGDDLFGYPIRRITKTSVTTDATTFLFTPSLLDGNIKVTKDDNK